MNLSSFAFKLYRHSVAPIVRSLF
ncbi:MAG: hypothetical protein JWQ04_3200, partial [Pedosphaera sp.]|nr:hypothetical protein [Pedosphaera sp.]